MPTHPVDDGEPRRRPGPPQSVSQRVNMRSRTCVRGRGIREGAVLALAACGKQPSTLSVTVDFEPLSGAVPFCAYSGADTPDRKGFLYSPPKQLLGWSQAAWTDPPTQATWLLASSAGAVSPPTRPAEGAL